MKQRNNATFYTVLGVGVILIVLMLMYAVISSRSSTSKSATEQASTNSNLAYASIGSNAANALSHQQEELANKLKEQERQQKALDEKNEQLKEIISKYKKDASKANPEILKKIEDLSNKLTQVSEENKKLKQKTNSDDDYSVGGANTSNPNKGKWITDEAVVADADVLSSTKLGLNSGLFNKTGTSNTSVNNSNDKLKKIPAFTMPDGTILTDIVTLTNLVGRVPKGDEHKVISPYEFHFHVDKDNLTSKNFKLPPQMKDITGRGHCVGDLVAKANSCIIDSITYIFPDGTISTVTAKENGDSSTQGLGYLTDRFGRTQIKGTLQSTIGLRVGALGAAGGVSALGAGIQQAGMNVPTGGGMMPFAAVSNVPLFAGGQAVGAAGQAANKEISDFTKNMFDYVITDNYDEEDHSLVKFNIVITTPIKFDYDPNGRMLDHHFLDNAQSQHSADLF